MSVRFDRRESRQDFWNSGAAETLGEFRYASSSSNEGKWRTECRRAVRSVPQLLTGTGASALSKLRIRFGEISRHALASGFSGGNLAPSG